MLLFRTINEVFILFLFPVVFLFAQKATINLVNQTHCYYKQSYSISINVNKKDEKNVIIKVSESIIISKDKKSFTPHPKSSRSLFFGHRFLQQLTFLGSG